MSDRELQKRILYWYIAANPGMATSLGMGTQVGMSNKTVVPLLKELLDAGLIRSTGSGVKADPRRYFKV
jgi:hypothetical protein